MNFLTFNGISSRDFGVFISGSGTFDTPERDIERISVPGRNGDLIIDNGRFKNIPVSYPAFIIRNFANKFDSFKAFLHAGSGYKRLEDTYHQEYFRMGCFKGPMNPEMKTLNESGEFTIIFDCMPQRWLKSGEESISFTMSSQILNPTLFPAKPLIKAYGIGCFYVGEFGVQITSADEYTIIDCDTMNAYKEITNCNENVSLLNKKFPVIERGITEIIMDGVSRLEIIPRWWTI